jgi:chemotaxis protein methyltransferase CheR
MSATPGHNRLEPATAVRRRYEYSFTAEDFQYVRNLIYQVAGISLAPSKKDLVYSRLSRRLRARRLNSFSAYLEVLEKGDQQELEAFTNALTTNMTSFFREPHHFQILEQYLATLGKSAPIDIWTCASSTGEEPYSMAMTVAEHFRSFNTPVRILATDIDTNVLEKAKQGRYTLEQLSVLNAQQTKNFFLKGYGKNSGLAKVRPELQKMIIFKRLNLLDERWDISERFDAVFCRNIMIYFDKTTQYRILKKMHACIKPHGLLFAGHSENFHHAADLFKVNGKTVYIPKH